MFTFGRKEFIFGSQLRRNIRSHPKNRLGNGKNTGWTKDCVPPMDS